MSIRNILNDDIDAQWKDIRCDTLQCNELQISGTPFTPLPVVEFSNISAFWRMEGASDTLDSAITTVVFYKIGSLVTASFDPISFDGSATAGQVSATFWLQTPALPSSFYPLNPSNPGKYNYNTVFQTGDGELTAWVEWDNVNNRFEFVERQGQDWKMDAVITTDQVSFTYISNDL